MGYESRVYVATKFDDVAFNKGYIDVLAEFNLSKMTDGFKDLFSKEIPNVLYINGEKVETDMYGDKLLYTDNIKSVINFLEYNFDYRRSRMLYNFLISVERDFDDLIIIHYGY